MTIDYAEHQPRSCDHVLLLITHVSLQITDIMAVLIHGSLYRILGQSLIYHLNPDTTTVWMEEMAFNGGHYVMA